jgi:dTDP-4-dehydrorhamnose 3,5-epimerase-like enzyme|tara:strand:+ start:4580 stop:5002 length:423 start_codon:yes stop_codon:yes gene_type:complete
MKKELEIINGGVAVDDRGSVRFVNDFNFDTVKRFYQVANHKRDFIRAWHAHEKEGKFVYVTKGSALVGAVNLKNEEITKQVLSASSPKVLYIPPGYANGFKSLEEDTIILFFSTSTLEDSLGDDIRFPYDKWNIWEEDYR